MVSMIGVFLYEAIDRLIPRPIDAGNRLEVATEIARWPGIHMVAANAPIANRRSNAFANRFLSTVTRTELRDTQCGMRRYPIDRVLSLGIKDDRFGFETEILLRAIRAKLRIVQVPIEVRYPIDRVTHFDARRDPWRIVGRVLRTLAGG